MCSFSRWCCCCIGGMHGASGFVQTSLTQSSFESIDRWPIVLFRGDGKKI